MAYMGSGGSVARDDARRWYDPAARTEAAWSAVDAGQAQQERISGIGTVLAVSLVTPGVPMRPKVVRWRNLCVTLIDLWSRVSMEDPGQFELDPDDATDDQILTAQELDPVWYATTTIAQATHEATRAITAAYDAGAHKRTINQMSFYFTREIEDLERMFVS
jgi:hypothetical protein